MTPQTGDIWEWTTSIGEKNYVLLLEQLPCHNEINGFRSFKALWLEEGKFFGVDFDRYLVRWRKVS